jgi:exodeoxyribonuclease V gamma subunit
LETSASYAERRHRGTSVDDTLPEVRRRWEADRFRPERDDPEHVMVFGPRAPFTQLTGQEPVTGEDYPNESTRFGVLARLVWDPLLTVETDERP